MSVQARFFVRAVEKHASGKGGSGWAPPAPIITVRLSPINGSKGSANKEWASATPSGEITMTIGNPAAAAWFEERLGEDVAITFADPQDD